LLISAIAVPKSQRQCGAYATKERERKERGGAYVFGSIMLLRRSNTSAKPTHSTVTSVKNGTCGRNGGCEKEWWAGIMGKEKRSARWGNKEVAARNKNRETNKGV